MNKINKVLHIFTYKNKKFLQQKIGVHDFTFLLFDTKTVESGK